MSPVEVSVPVMIWFYIETIRLLASHSGTAIPRFIDNYVVWVEEWDKRPKRLVEAINRIREISINDQVCLWYYVLLLFVLKLV